MALEMMRLTVLVTVVPFVKVGRVQDVAGTQPR
jgi:hypothetical protein